MSISVEALISEMEWAARNTLEEYAFARDGHRVTLWRGGASGLAETAQDGRASVGVAASDASDEAGGNAEEDQRLGVVAAPMAGICYLARDPGAAPFVEVGAAVTKGQTVCVIEAMKVMSAIVADRDGTVREVCVEDGATVSAGDCLVRVEA